MVKLLRWFFPLGRSQVAKFSGWIVIGLMLVYAGAHDVVTGQALYGRWYPKIITPRTDPIFFWAFPTAGCILGLGFVIYGVHRIRRTIRERCENSTQTI
jgi:hypothetical protein